MRVLEVNVRPVRQRSGRYTLYEITTYDQPIPGRPFANRSKKVVWPLCMGENGRGKLFGTVTEAFQFFADNKSEDAVYGLRTRLALERLQRGN